MSLFMASLNSGSNGNCYYVGNSKEAVLVDAGISCREIEKRMKRLELPMPRLKAVFISHEHSDHISGLAVLARKYSLPVYITTPTLRHSGLSIDPVLVRDFTPHEPVMIGELCVKAFSKHHDASDPYSFTITGDRVTVGVFTDIGVSCTALVHHFRQCHAAFLEANYDDDMLDQGRYPYFLKQRIRSGKGHLSNRQALELVRAHKPAFMSHLVLAHLSRNNNRPELVQQLFDEAFGDTRIVVASRYAETQVYAISDAARVSPMPELPPFTQLQMELF